MSGENQVKKVYNFVSLLFLTAAFFLVFHPFIPKIVYAVFRPEVVSFENSSPNLSSKKNSAIVSLRGSEINNPSKISLFDKQSDERILKIDKIGVDGEIHEGDNRNLLREGIWRLPWTSTPEEGGNTVIVAHRFLKTSGPETFYNLDKLSTGDIIKLFWNGRLYEYEVYESKVVPPTALEIEAESLDPILTLYTCTPLWTATDRLVVRAKPFK